MKDGVCRRPSLPTVLTAVTELRSTNITAIVEAEQDLKLQAYSKQSRSVACEKWITMGARMRPFPVNRRGRRPSRIRSRRECLIGPDWKIWHVDAEPAWPGRGRLAMKRAA